MTTPEQPRPLKRTMAPYVGQIVIFSLVTALMVYSLVRTPDLKTLEFTLVLVLGLWSLFLIQVYFFGLKYKIFASDAGVRQHASGGPDVCIHYNEITKVTTETSNAAEVAAGSRPFRRIAIYAQQSHSTQKFIDVSLKHFAEKDIRRLIAIIHEHRPDLELPKKWLG